MGQRWCKSLTTWFLGPVAGRGDAGGDGEEVGGGAGPWAGEGTSAAASREGQGTMADLAEAASLTGGGGGAEDGDEVKPPAPAARRQSPLLPEM